MWIWIGVGLAIGVPLFMGLAMAAHDWRKYHRDHPSIPGYYGRK